MESLEVLEFLNSPVMPKMAGRRLIGYISRHPARTVLEIPHPVLIKIFIPDKMSPSVLNDVCVILVSGPRDIRNDVTQGDSITQNSSAGTYSQRMCEYYERKLDVINRGYSGV